ncbi:MAG: hypothetical protein AAGF11_39090 [Myxococcota bacterium]
MSEPLPVPRFDPLGPAPGFGAERRRRLLVLAMGALVLALVASSVANASRASLRCIEGQLVPFRGRLLPVGEEPLDDDAHPALRVPPSACDDELFESRSAFEERYVELALSQADPGEQPEERLAAESAVDALDAMSQLPIGAGEQFQLRRRTLLHGIVQHKVEQARESQQEAIQWIERARRAGADPAVLRAAERSLGLHPSSPAPPEKSVDAITSPAPRQAVPPTASSRSL